VANETLHSTLRSNGLCTTPSKNHGKLTKIISSMRKTGKKNIHAEVDASASWDSLAFQQKNTFPPCTTQFFKDRDIAHTHSTERCYKLQPPKGKGAPGKGENSLLFTKGSKGKGHGKGKARKRQRSSEWQSRQRKAAYLLF
jgi:hypothetical protein